MPCSWANTRALAPLSRHRRARSSIALRRSSCACIEISSGTRMARCLSYEKTAFVERLQYLDTLSTAAPDVLVETAECLQPAGCDRRPAHRRLRRFGLLPP